MGGGTRFRLSRVKRPVRYEPVSAKALRGGFAGGFAAQDA